MENTRGDLTRTVSQDQNRFCYQFLSCYLNKIITPRGVFGLPEKENFFFAFQWKAFKPPFSTPRLFPVKTLRISFSFWTSYICISLSPLRHFLCQRQGCAEDVLGCTSGVGVHIWSCLREPGASPLKHKHRDSRNVSLSVSLWLLWQLVFFHAGRVCAVWMQRWSHRAPWAVTGMENSSLQHPQFLRG